MNNSSCAICHSPKAPHTCGICSDSLCKNCAQFLEEDTFSFMRKVPEQLKHNVYCSPCYSSQVEPAIAKYDDMMKQAKNLEVYFKDQGKETRNFKRDVPSYKIPKCTDREETLLRLAFFAVEDGYNALIDVDLRSEKIRNGSYQTLNWSGTALPANTKARR
ncbi:hypothetical protein [Bdellovibrio reynosensis]|uniref:B box-type domain-containing protein n=1 Tax=Bdellovibrio reynosensis TaxID=2835041 RepID=A0ABY4CAX1_9BACT|nr:hypothetical protein [Bdellovibrio reynosensis]UOF00658.1 hypothetical protein MNR06_13220 [Bdellovibrio reynosensis]